MVDIDKLVKEWNDRQIIDKQRMEDERDRAYALSYVNSLCEWGYITIDEYKELKDRIEEKKPSVNIDYYKMNGYFGYDTWYKEKFLKDTDIKGVKMVAVDLAEDK